jgi:hypothetical protein
VVSLAPHIVENHVPHWPLSLDEPRAGSDEFWAAVRAFELTQGRVLRGRRSDGRAACAAVIQRALTALSRALLERGALTGDEVRAIVEAEMLPFHLWGGMLGRRI